MDRSFVSISELLEENKARVRSETTQLSMQRYREMLNESRASVSLEDTYAL